MVFQLVNALLRCYIWFSVLRGAHQALRLAPGAIRRAGAERRRAALRDALRVLVTWALWCYTERLAYKITWLLPLYDVGLFFALICFALLRNQFALALYVQAAPFIRPHEPWMDAVLLQSANFVAGAAFLASLLLANIVLRLKQTWAKLRGTAPAEARPIVSQPAEEQDVRVPPPSSRSRRTRASSFGSDEGDTSNSSVRGPRSLLRPPSNQNLAASASSRSLRHSTSASSLRPRDASSLALRRAPNGTRGAGRSVSGASANVAGPSKPSASPAERLAALPAAPSHLPGTQAAQQVKPEPSESTPSKLYPDPPAAGGTSSAGMKQSDSPAALRPPVTQSAAAAFATPQVPGAFGATRYGLATPRAIPALNALGMPPLGSPAVDVEGPPSARIAARMQEATSSAAAQPQEPPVSAPSSSSLAPAKPAPVRKTSSSTSARIAPSRGLKASEPQRQVPPPTPRARAKARAQKLRAHSSIQLRDDSNGAEDDLELELPPELPVAAAGESRKANGAAEGLRSVPTDLVPPPSRTTRTKFTPAASAAGAKKPTTNMSAYRTKAQSFTSSASAATPSTARAPSSSVPTPRAGIVGEGDETLTHPPAPIGKKRKEPPAQPMSSTPAPKRATRARATRSTSAAPPAVAAPPPVASTSTTPAAAAAPPKVTAKARALAKAKRGTLSRSTSRNSAFTEGTDVGDSTPGAAGSGAEAFLGSEVDAEMAEKALRALIEGAGAVGAGKGMRGSNSRDF